MENWGRWCQLVWKQERRLQVFNSIWWKKVPLYFVSHSWPGTPEKRSPFSLLWKIWLPLFPVGQKEWKEKRKTEYKRRSEREGKKSVGKEKGRRKKETKGKESFTWLARVTPKCFISVSREFVSHDCFAKLFHKSVMQGSSMSVSRECHPRVSYKSVFPSLTRVSPGVSHNSFPQVRVSCKSYKRDLQRLQESNGLHGIQVHWRLWTVCFSSCEFCVWRGDKGGSSLLNFLVCVCRRFDLLPCSTGAGGSSTIRTVARRSFGPLQRIHPGQPAWIRDLSDWRWTFSAVSHLFSRIPANDFLFQRQCAGMWQWALCQLSQIGRIQIREWVHDHANCRVGACFRFSISIDIPASASNDQLRALLRRRSITASLSLPLLPPGLHLHVRLRRHLLEFFLYSREDTWQDLGRGKGQKFRLPSAPNHPMGPLSLVLRQILSLWTEQV